MPEHICSKEICRYNNKSFSPFLFFYEITSIIKLVSLIRSLKYLWFHRWYYINVNSSCLYGANSDNSKKFYRNNLKLYLLQCKRCLLHSTSLRFINLTFLFGCFIKMKRYRMSMTHLLNMNANLEEQKAIIR